MRLLTKQLKYLSIGVAVICVVTLAFFFRQGLSPSGLLTLVIIGCLSGGIYGLIAASLSLIFGVLKVANIAHGGLMLLAAYAAFFLSPFVSFVIWIPLTLALMFFIGLLIHTSVIKPILGHGSEYDRPILATFAISLILQNLMLVFWTGRSYFLFSSVPVPITDLLGFLGGVIATFSLWSVLTKTRLGMSIRATAQERELATMLGVNAHRVDRLAYGIGILYAGFAGILIALVFAFDPTYGLIYTFKGFTVVVLAGTGSFIGALIAGLILGLVESIGGYYLGSGMQNFIVYVVFIIILLFRPQGFFGNIRSL